MRNFSLKDSLRAKQWHGKSNDVDLEKATAAAKVARECRKLDRDMNRIERAQETSQRTESTETRARRRSALE